MIGSLRGRITSKAPPQVTLEVDGVGYEVEAPMSTFLHLPAVGEEVKLLTHFVVREDAQLLYGFASEREKRLFRELLKVSSVGPKLALSLLSGMSVDNFLLCIESEDVTTLVRVPGVGRKTAERLLIEMRDRIKGLGGPILTGGVNTGAPAATGPQAEAFSALTALGYKPAEVVQLLKSVDPAVQTTEELIRAALQSAVIK